MRTRTFEAAEIVPGNTAVTGLGDPIIRLDNVSLEFEMSYDKSWTLVDQARRLLTSLLRPSEKEIFYALKDVSFEARPGDVVGIIGPNGSGKTTFLRVVSGIFRPDSGTVTTEGRISTLLSLGVGFNTAMTGRVNLRLAALLSGLSNSEIDERIGDVADFTELGDFLDVPMKYYSNGMISRLNFATLLLIEPEIVLIDEIFSVGDLAFEAKSRAAMNSMLKKAKCQLLVTHSLSLVEERCNRALLFDSGRLLVDGEPKEVVMRYRELAASRSG